MASGLNTGSKTYIWNQNCKAWTRQYSRLPNGSRKTSSRRVSDADASKAQTRKLEKSTNSFRN